MVQAGTPAPDFTVPDATGAPVKLSDFRGKTVVLYFYPKADTPGCTKESCAFRDAQGDFTSSNIVILGISADDQNAQSKFAEKYGLPFQLLCDTDHSIAEAYGTWVEKNNYGKKYMGIQRATFIIGPDGEVKKVFPRVTVDGHAEEVLQAAQAVGQ